MPVHSTNGVDLFYRIEGDGPETVVLSHSFLVDHRQFDAQIAALSPHFRVVAYDHRGHGRSSEPGSRYSMEQIYEDAVSLLEAVVDGPCHFVGLSTGAFVGLRLSLRRPELIDRLVLMGASADLEPWLDRARLAVMLRALPLVGWRPLIGSTMSTMFGSRFLRDEARSDEVELWRRRMMENDRGAIVRFARAVFGRDPVEDRLGEISVPTLVVSGEDDSAQAPKRGRAMADGIANARFELLEHAGHLSTIEEPAAVNELLLPFLLPANP
jgi:3-oxoadipate enol-lactonase